MNIDNKSINKLINISNRLFKNIVVLVFLISIYIILLMINRLEILVVIKTIISLLSPLFIGIAISWLLRPIVNYFERVGINRIVSLVFVYLFLLFFIYVLIVTFIPRFIKEVSLFISIFPSIIDDLGKKISIVNVITSNYSIDSIILDISKKIPITFVNVFKVISNILLGFIIGFYLLISNSIVTIKREFKKDTYELILKINSILRTYVKVSFFSSFIVFILCFIIFKIISLENALFYAFICGLTNFIPIIGPYIGGVIPCIVGFTKSITFGIVVILILFIIQTIEGNIITPIIMSKSINIHPILSILGFLIFGYFLGIFGIIFAIPLVASVKEIYYYLLKRYKSYNRNLVK